MSNHLQISKSRAAAPRNSDGPSRADRAAKSASTKPGAAFAVVARHAGEVRRIGPGNHSRFAAFAAASDADAVEIETAAAQLHVPGLRTPMSRAEFHRQANAGFSSETDCTASMHRAIGTMRGQPTAPKSAVPVQHDVATPDGVAAATLAAARRAGIVK